ILNVIGPTVSVVCEECRYRRAQPMAMGKKRARQQPLWIATGELPRTRGHVFYDRVNEILKDEKFDEFAEKECVRFYKSETMGRPSVAPGVYFRMLMVGYFEGIDAERGIAWRCADSLSLKSFLGFALTESTPDHSTVSRTRRLIDLETHGRVFTWMLQVLAKHGLIDGKTIGVDGTTLEANAAMRSIVRRDTGESYTEFLTKLAKASGIETPTQEELVTDKGYHSNDTLVDLKEFGIRSYISEPKRGQRNGIGKKAERDAVYANRRRIRGDRGKSLLRRRGLMLERPFAHCYETGGMRRTHLRGRENILKRLLIHIAGFNLSLVLRLMIGKGTPRGLQDLALAYFLTLIAVIKCFWQVLEARIGSKIRGNAQIAARVFADRNFKLETTATGC